jgi:acyl-CoA synthetase (NDP forming)
VVLLLASSLGLPRLRSVYMAALRSIREQHPDRLIMLCVRGPQDAVAELHAMGFPTVDGIDACCNTLASLAKLGQASRSAAEPVPAVAPAAPLSADAFRHEFGAKRALAAVGIPVLPEQLVTDADAAVHAAEALGFPVVMKIASKDLPHKTEVGGVKVGLTSAQEVRAAYDEMRRTVAAKAPAAVVDGVLIAPMAKGVAELILGTTTDPIFGPVVMVGLGGIFAEIIQDTAVQTAPVSEPQAASMLRSLKAFPVLNGARGRPPADLEAAAQAVAALSRFAAAHADAVSEIDINPLLLMPKGQGAVALDALLVPRAKADVKEKP